MPRPAPVTRSRRLHATLAAAPVLFAHSFVRCHFEKTYRIGGSSVPYAVWRCSSVERWRREPPCAAAPVLWVSLHSKLILLCAVLVLQPLLQNRQVIRLLAQVLGM